MKRVALTATLTAIMIMMSSVFCFAEGDLTLVSSYPEDGQKNTSMENLGVKLTFSNPINSEEAKKVDESKFNIVDEDGETVPVQVLFSEKNDGLVLVLANADEGFTAKNNSEYTLNIEGGLVDNEGNVMEEAKKISFRTYNQRANSMVNMAMMLVMFGGIMFITMRQNLKAEGEDAQDDIKDQAFNPYKEAKKTGKSIEEIKAEQAKKEAKQAKRKAKKSKSDDDKQEKRIENCAELLNNVYHVHAPAPINKADRSIEALKASRKSSDTKKSSSKKSGKK